MNRVLKLFELSHVTLTLNRSRSPRAFLVRTVFYLVCFLQNFHTTNSIKGNAFLVSREYLEDVLRYPVNKQVLL